MLLRFGKGTGTAADAAGLPGENRVEFPFGPAGKQSRAFPEVFCEVGVFPHIFVGLVVP